MWSRDVLTQHLCRYVRMKQRIKRLLLFIRFKYVSSFCELCRNCIEVKEFLVIVGE